MNAPILDPGCTGKTRYASKADAIRCIQFRDKAGRNKAIKGRGTLQPYQCCSCGHWHVGSSALREINR